MSKRKQKSEFRAWFDEQHGKINSLPCLAGKTDEELGNIIALGKYAESERVARLIRERQEWSALAAWSAAKSKEVQP